jgi:hypothetical protein
MDYTKINTLYGTPITQLPRPIKFETWHLVAGLVIVGLAGYGVYSLTQNFNPVFAKAEPKISKYRDS